MRLRDLVDSSFKVGDRVLVAELSSVDLDPYKQQVLINKGSAIRRVRRVSQSWMRTPSWVR